MIQPPKGGFFIYPYSSFPCGKVSFTPCVTLLLHRRCAVLDKKIDGPSDVEFAEAITKNLPKHDREKTKVLGAAAVAIALVNRAKRK